MLIFTNVTMTLMLVQIFNTRGKQQYRLPKSNTIYTNGATPPVSYLTAFRSIYIRNKFVGTNDINTNILQHHGMPKQVSVKLKKDIS